MIDPISKNPIPLGSKASEVRDDIVIKVSEGEYVIPADVVRYLGLDKIEKLVEKAKEGIQEISVKGRIGGGQEEEDDFPFTPEELISQTQEDLPTEPVGMAAGGLVTQPMSVAPLKDVQRTAPMFKTMGTTNIAPPTDPLLLLPKTGTNMMERAAEEEAKRKELGMGGSVKDWEVDDYAKYAKQRVDPATQLIQKGISTLIPFGGLAVKHRNTYLGKAVPESINQMLKSGVDRNGKSLTEQQRAQLQDTLSKISVPVEEKGLGAAFGLNGLMKGLLGKDRSKPVPKPETEKPKPKESEKPDKSSQSSSSSKDSGGSSSSSSKSGKSSGGSIDRRK